MKRISVIVAVAALCLAFFGSGAEAVKRPISSDPLLKGDEIVSAPIVYPSNQDPSAVDDADVIGDTVTIGTTWWEVQHNGTIGRMVEKSQDGYLHFTWMNATDIQATDRHIYYNFIDPWGAQGWPGTGYPIEASERAGYPTLDVDAGGNPVIAFNWLSPTWGVGHTAVYISPFTYLEPPLVNGLGLIWPRMQLGRNGLIHVVSVLDDPGGQPGSPLGLYYIAIGSDSVWTPVCSTMTSAAEVATSDVSDRVAFGWTYCRDDGFPSGTSFSQINNDICILVDEDGQDPDFSQAFNLTTFIWPDLSWLPDTLLANMDTLRAYTDLSLFFDQDDWLHAAFTTRAYFAIQGYSYWNASLIWHWSEEFPGEYQTVANAFDPDDWIDCGAWNVKVQRPSLGQDPESGFLYCMYQQYDTDSTALSAAGWPSGEVYVSVSVDGGMNWSVGTNITQTVTPSGAPPYQCLSELCPTMAKEVNDTCHIMYVLDYDAGFVVQGEGSWTLNPVKYHSVSTDSIPTTPLVPQWPDSGGVPFHVEHGSYARSGEVHQPARFALDKPFPNPFNPVTTISFELRVGSFVKLEVFDIAGRHVGAGFKPAPTPGSWYHPGIHRISFDGSRLPSGIYIYRLQAGEFIASGKMVLIK